MNSEMAIEQLKQDLSTFFSNSEEIAIRIFFILKNDKKGHNDLIKKANIKHDDAKNILTLILNNFNDDIIKNDRTSLFNLTQSDERKHVIYKYDLSENLNIFDDYTKVSNDHFSTFDGENIFTPDEDGMANITGCIIELKLNGESCMYIYRKFYPINVFKRSKYYYFWNDKNQFENFNKDLLRFDGKIDFFNLNKINYIINMKLLESLSEYRPILQRKATEIINNRLSHLVADTTKAISVLNNAKNMSLIKKINHVSTIVEKLQPNHIMGFINDTPQLREHLKYNNDGKLLLGDTHSLKLFADILQDNYLHSNLTNLDYVSIAKDELSD